MCDILDDPRDVYRLVSLLGRPVTLEDMRDLCRDVDSEILEQRPYLERNGVLEACRKLDIALIAYRPLAGGRNRQDGPALDRTLAGIARARQKTVAQVALNWLLRKDEHIVAISGTTSVAHLRENVGAVGWTLNDNELAVLEQSSA